MDKKFKPDLVINTSDSIQLLRLEKAVNDYYNCASHFDEFTLVISGKKQVIVNNKKITLRPGQSIKVFKNSRVQYSNPYDEPCKYVSVCTPAFSIKNVNREL